MHSNPPGSDGLSDHPKTLITKEPGQGYEYSLTPAREVVNVLVAADLGMFTHFGWDSCSTPDRQSNAKLSALPWL